MLILWVIVFLNSLYSSFFIILLAKKPLIIKISGFFVYASSIRIYLSNLIESVIKILLFLLIIAGFIIYGLFCLLCAYLLFLSASILVSLAIGAIGLFLLGWLGFYLLAFLADLFDKYVKPNPKYKHFISKIKTAKQSSVYTRAVKPSFIIIITLIIIYIYEYI